METTENNPLLLATLQRQMANKEKGGIYHRLQVDMTYNSNHIEGSRLTQDQTRYIFETNTIGATETAINVDDIIETTNHFRAIDYVITHATEQLTESMILHLHRILKTGTSDAAKDWFAVGDYKRLPNEVGGMATSSPETARRDMLQLLTQYNRQETHTFDDILDFHHRFEQIHPFQDGNGRIGRLILLKECLANDFVPFIITEELKMFYYRGLREWPCTPGYLRDTCLAAQDHFKTVLDYFRIPYKI